ncbi:MAG: hypothetical protein Q8L10_03450 [Candidatus Moranbacteria bacterium]|nr:hypothetical protein [Candidatus Moranbacteria bacterium]
MPQDDICWRKARESARPQKSPDRDLVLSQSFVNGARLRASSVKCAKNRLADIKTRGFYEGCTVRMNNTGRLKEVARITPDGRFRIEGAERLCVPSDCTFIK